MCTGRLCIEPRMKVDARTSRRTVIYTGQANPIDYQGYLPNRQNTRGTIKETVGCKQPPAPV